MTPLSDRYIVLNIGCAECRSTDETLVTVMGVVPVVGEAKELAMTAAKYHNFVEPWRECSDGWFAVAGDGELRIIDLGGCPDKPTRVSGPTADDPR